MAESREKRLAEIRVRWQPRGMEDLTSVQDISFLLDTIDANTALADEIIEMQNGLLLVHKRRTEAAVHVALVKERAGKVFFHEGEHDAIVAAAVAAETERCAKLVDDWVTGGRMGEPNPWNNLIAAIREPR